MVQPQHSKQLHKKGVKGTPVKVGQRFKHNATAGDSSTRSWGEGAERLTYEPDKQKGIWKVAPPFGSRFSPAFLKALSAWAHHMLQHDPLSTPPATAPIAKATPVPINPVESALSPPSRNASHAGGADKEKVECSEGDPCSPDGGGGEVSGAPPPLPPSPSMLPLPPPLGQTGPQGAAAAADTPQQVAKVTDDGAAGTVEQGGAVLPPRDIADGAAMTLLPDGHNDDIQSCSHDINQHGHHHVTETPQVLQQSSEDESDDSDNADDDDDDVSDDEADAALMAAEDDDLLEEIDELEGLIDHLSAAILRDDLTAPAQMVKGTPKDKGKAAQRGGQARQVSGRQGSARGRGKPAVSSPAAIGSTLPPGRVSVSLRLERMALTDREAAMISEWYVGLGQHHVHLRKLWLFDNRLTDVGAAAVAQLIDEHTTEVHLSHNAITLEGAKAILSAVPSCALPRPSGNYVWLRMEWNVVDVEALKQVISGQRAERGLVVDVPQQVAASNCKWAHESNLAFSSAPCHVKLPWINAQRLQPAQAPLLQDARNLWGRRVEPQTQQTGRQGRPQVPPAVNVGGDRQLPPPGEVGGYVTGPLLLFPDTSVFLAMLGAQNGPTTSTPFSLRALEMCADAGLFGGGLIHDERSFIVVTDSVMKQMDGLKVDPKIGVAVRRFLGHGLDACGPAGHDFLTVLGGHEGEGLVVDDEWEVAGSRHVKEKGHKVDVKIVEVGLYFQKEILQARFSVDADQSVPQGSTTDSTPGKPENQIPADQSTPEEQPGSIPCTITEVASGTHHSPADLHLATPGSCEAGAEAPGSTTAMPGSAQSSCSSSGDIGRGAGGIGVQQTGSDYGVLGGAVGGRALELKGPPGPGSSTGTSTTMLGAPADDFSFLSLFQSNRCPPSQDTCPSPNMQTAPAGKPTGNAQNEPSKRTPKTWTLSPSAAISDSPRANGGQDGSGVVVPQSGQGVVLPVILLSNDNAQVQLARSHGLPAVKLAELQLLQGLLRSNQQVTASAIRGVIGQAALKGLGTRATRSIHDEFDSAVAALRAMTDCATHMKGLLDAVSLQLSSSQPPERVVHDIASLLRGENAQADGPPTRDLSPSAPARTSGHGGYSSLLSSAEEKLRGWEGLVKVHHCPSRILKWTNQSALE